MSNQDRGDRYIWPLGHLNESLLAYSWSGICLFSHELFAPSGQRALQPGMWCEDSSAMLLGAFDSSALERLRPEQPIAENTFRGCQLLNSITVPGCIDFGYKAFADCCSLQWMVSGGDLVSRQGKR